MGLICNGYRPGYFPGKMIGGALTTIYNGSRMPTMFHKTSMMRGFSRFTTQYSSQPEGCRHPHVWMMPQKAGRLASRNNVTGAGEITTDIWAVRLATAGLTGSGTISNALGGLIVQLVAALAGTGTISNADMKAFLAAVASLSGSGNVSSATLIAFGALISALSGSGTTVGSAATGIGELAADILSYGNLTPEGLRDAVWSALAANYNVAGTMGEKLNDAGSAANPWTEDLSGSLTEDTAGWILVLIRKLLQNKRALDPTTGVETIYDDDGTTPLYTRNVYVDVTGTTPYDGTSAPNRVDRYA